MFTGDFNDFDKIIENSAIETYFQVFTGDFNDLKKILTIQGLKRIFKFSLDSDLRFFHAKPPQNKKLPRSWF